MPFHLLKKEPIEVGLRRIAHEQIDIAVANFRDDTTPQHRQVHSLRCRCKKLRGLLRLTQPLMGYAFLIEDQRFRAAAKALAEHRESDVIAKTIESLGGSYDQSGTSQTQVSSAAIKQALEMIRTCQGAVDSWPLHVHGFADLAPGFSRTYRKCLDAFDRVLREPNDENFHRLRKWAKYHWYQVRILERLNKTEIRKQRKKLRMLQLALGSAHDLALLQAMLESQNDCDMWLLDRAVDRKKTLYADALTISHEIFARSGDELVADYSRWWVDWAN